MPRSKVRSLTFAVTLHLMTCWIRPINSSGCVSVGDCSQICNGTSECACISGFQLDTDNKSCNPSNPNWKILTVTWDKISFITNAGGRASDTVHVPLPRPVTSITHDARNGVLYYVVKSLSAVFRTEIVSNKPVTSYMANRGLLYPDSVAFDWITGNLYYIERSLSQIMVCGNNSDITIGCARVLFGGALSTGHSITLEPNLGIMFWVEVVNNRSVIFRADMDGADTREITGRLSPLVISLAIDVGNRLVYWYQAGDKVIHLSDVSGKRGKIIPHDLLSLINSVDVFGDNVYWMGGNETTHTIWSANKFTGANVTNHGGVLSGTGQKMAIYDPANQPILRENPCKSSKTTCTHLCVLSPPLKSNGHYCLYPRCHLNPVRTGVLTCHKGEFCHPDKRNPVISNDTDYLVLAYDNVLAFAPTNNLHHFPTSLRFERLQITGINTINALVKNPFNDTIILTNFWEIFEYNFHAKILHALVPAEEAGYVLSMALDEQGENLYWISYNGSVNVMSLVTRQKLELVRDLEKPCEIFIMPDQRAFLVAVQQDAVGIVFNKYEMDGSPLASAYHIPGSSKCPTLAYDQQNEYIFWARPGYTGGIFYIDLRTNNTNPIFSMASQRLAHHPSSIARYTTHTFWVDSKNLTFNRIEKFEEKSISRPFLPEGELCQAKYELATQLKSQLILLNRLKYTGKVKIQQQCRAFNCSHVCLVASPIQGQPWNTDPLKCHCPAGFKLALDHKTCVKVARSSPIEPDNTKPTTTGESTMPSIDANCHEDFQPGVNSTVNDTGTESITIPFVTRKYQTENPPGTGLSKIPTVLFALLLTFLICFASVLLAYYFPRGKGKIRQSNLSESEIQKFFEGTIDASTNYEGEPYHVQTWEIPKDSFEIDRQKSLGKGMFGEMFMGSINRNVFLNYTDSEAQSEMLEKEMRMTVRVKTCMRGSVHALHGFLTELKLKVYLGQHENIVSLIGAYTHELGRGRMYMFTEFCELGPLLDHLHLVENGDGSLLEKWTVEVAAGMEFLAEKKIIHGALSARNIYLTSSKTAKITGFGGARRNGRNYSFPFNKNTQEPPSWRWMAPEVLECAEFTEKSDVWALGVTLWEIHTFGKIPFAGLSRKKYKNLLKSGDAFLEKPDGCDSGIYSTMLKCWSIDATVRPTFAEVKEELIDMFNSFV